MNSQPFFPSNPEWPQQSHEVLFVYFCRTPVLTPELQEEVKKKSETRVLGVSTAIYQHPPPTILCGGAKMESEKQWEMEKETQRNDPAKDP
jgi:hypothetical protein